MNDYKRDNKKQNDFDIEDMLWDKGDLKDNEMNIIGEFDSLKTEKQSGEEFLSEEAALSEMKALRDEIQQKKKDYSDLSDKHIRLVADFENYKKRMMKERADIMAYANEDLIKEMLGIADNLERAIKHSESAEDGRSLADGVKLVYRQFLNTLEKFGVKLIEVGKGEKFDPRYHQAVEHVVSDEITPGLIVSQLLTGYTLKNKLLRPSIVVVSRAMERKQENGYAD